MILSRGTTLGRFVVLGTLGTGGMGVVLSAFDPWLDRKVALKLLRPRPDDAPGAGRRTALLLREAQAMARIAHRNVIAVHDVGTVDDQVFIAMEHVDGETLTRWLETPRGWREIAARFALAARGLAAAHALGLVHRDFKPDNVLVARDGRVLVTDFGVVGVAAESGDGGAPASLPRTGFTSDRVIVGTHAYMAPEQRAGGPVDDRADQYSLCVALERALAGHGAPRRLRRLAQRGLAVDPAARHRSMGALADRLERLPGRPARVAVAAAFAAALLAVLALRRGGADRVCAGLETRLAGVWDAPRRAAIERAFGESALPYAPEALRAVTGGLDAWAEGWVRTRTDACQGTRVRGDQSEELLDLRVECLDARRGEARALVDLLAQADDKAIERGPQAVAALERVNACANAALLRAPVRAPRRPALAAAVADVRARLALAAALRAVGRYPDALAHARAAAVAAQGLGYGPLIAEAELRLALGLINVSDVAGGRGKLIDAAAAADRSRRDDVKAFAFLTLFDLIGQTQRDAAGAEPYRGMAAATIERLGEREDPGRELSARLARAEGSVLYNAGRFEEALGRWRTAIAMWQRIDPHSLELPGLRASISGADTELGRFDEALLEARAALELRERALGPRHPLIAPACNGVGMVLTARNDFRGARAYFERAVAVAGNDTVRSLSLKNLASVDAKLGDHANAVAEAQRAAALAEKIYGRDTLRHADALITLATVQHLGGDDAAALPNDRSAVATYEKTVGPDHGDLALPLLVLGEIELEAGRLDDAGRDLERAGVLLDKSGMQLNRPALLVDLGRLALRRGRTAEARATAARARAAALALENREAAADADFLSAETYAKEDPARARVLAAAARDAFAALHLDAQARRVETWRARLP